MMWNITKMQPTEISFSQWCSSQTNRLQCESAGRRASVFVEIKQYFLDGADPQRTTPLPFYRVSRLHWDIHRPSKQKVGRPIRRSCQTYFFESHMKRESAGNASVRVVRVIKKKKEKKGKKKSGNTETLLQFQSYRRLSLNKNWKKNYFHYICTQFFVILLCLVSINIYVFYFTVHIFKHV